MKLKNRWIVSALGTFVPFITRREANMHAANFATFGVSSEGECEAINPVVTRSLVLAAA